MENQVRWHAGKITKEQYIEACKKLDDVLLKEVQ